ncbi:MAG: YqzL family protein [Clostridia bacterium]|nr:YqzL family protein [Clostridia bacterium]
MKKNEFAENAWKLFEKTGRIGYYLLYKKTKED